MKSFSTLRIVCIALLLITTLGWWGCSKIEEVPTTTIGTTVNYSPKLPQAWMTFSYNAVKKQGWFALDASRLYAYAAITAYESMVNGIPGARSLEYQIQGLSKLPKPENGKTYDWGIVLCHTMPQVLEAMMPTMVNTTKTEMEVMADQQFTTLQVENNLSAEVIENSKAFADALAKAIIDWSATDNRVGLEQLSYVAPSRIGNPQYWDGTTLGQTFMMPFWWTSRPFVINSYKICPVEAPYIYSTDPASAYYKDVKEVYDASLDPDKVNIGKFWANNPGLSGTPAGSWLAIGNQLVDQQKLDLPTTLKMYVLLTIGTRDAFIACWYLKYKYNLQRPVTYIREVLGQTTWTSPVPTPPYPDYTSGTSTNAGISSEMLTRLFGNKSFSDSQHEDKGFGVRSFNSFKEAGREAYHSRIFGGVHMRRACELGFQQGECIGEYIWNNLKFK
jgi:hypothetical protein